MHIYLSVKCMVVSNPDNARELKKYDLLIYVQYFKKLSTNVRKCLPVRYKTLLYYIAIENLVCYIAVQFFWERTISQLILNFLSNSLKTYLILQANSFLVFAPG
jgi:hypothetical protein